MGYVWRVLFWPPRLVSLLRAASPLAVHESTDVAY